MMIEFVIMEDNNLMGCSIVKSLVVIATLLYFLVYCHGYCKTRRNKNQNEQHTKLHSYTVTGQFDLTTQYKMHLH